MLATTTSNTFDVELNIKRLQTENLKLFSSRFQHPMPSFHSLVRNLDSHNCGIS